MIFKILTISSKKTECRANFDLLPGFVAEMKLTVEGFQPRLPSGRASERGRKNSIVLEIEWLEGLMLMD